MPPWLQSHPQWSALYVPEPQMHPGFQNKLGNLSMECKLHLFRLTNIHPKDSNCCWCLVVYQCFTHGFYAHIMSSALSWMAPLKRSASNSNLGTHRNNTRSWMENDDPSVGLEAQKFHWKKSDSENLHLVQMNQILHIVTHLRNLGSCYRGNVIGLGLHDASTCSNLGFKDSLRRKKNNPKWRCIFVVMPSLYRSKMESMYLHQLLSKTNHRVSLGFPSCCGIFCNSNSRSCSTWKSCNLHAHYIYRVNSIICHEVGSLAKRWGRVISRWNSTSSMEHSNRGSCEHHLEAPSRHTFQAKKLW